MTDADRTPKRIQRKRTRGWKMPEGAVYVGRPSRWGNPFAVDKTAVFDEWSNDGGWWTFNSEREARAYAVVMYRGWLSADAEVDPGELRGRDLACWCPLDQPCHVDVLLEIANRGDA